MKYENTRSDFKCCDYWEKWKAICQTAVVSNSGAQGEFFSKPEFQYDVWCLSHNTKITKTYER